MLDFSQYLNSINDSYYRRSHFDLNSNSCRYLLAVQKHPKAFRLTDENLNKLINNEASLANVDVFHFLLRFKSWELRSTEKSIFERRLDLVCSTLELSEIKKDLLRLIFLINYEESISDLNKSISDACNSWRKINYTALGVLINHTEENVLEAVSGERGLRNLGFLENDSLEIPLEIRKYLKGLGSNNFMDIYATIDKK